MADHEDRLDAHPDLTDRFDANIADPDRLVRRPPPAPFEITQELSAAGLLSDRQVALLVAAGRPHLWTNRDDLIGEADRLLAWLQADPASPPSTMNARPDVWRWRCEDCQSTGEVWTIRGADVLVLVKACPDCGSATIVGEWSEGSEPRPSPIGGPMCEAMGHEAVPAIGTIRLLETGTVHAYCGECLDVLRTDPHNTIVRMWAAPPWADQ